MRKLILILCLTILPLLPSYAVGQDQDQPATYNDPVTGMQFVRIPGGTFTMGYAHEKTSLPTHQVTVPSFYMSKFEVTFAQYDQFCQETGTPFSDDEGWGRGIRPVINVNWHNAVAYSQWLSRKTGRTFRLPTEAEWEYAARGGKTARFPWGDEILRGKANCRGCGSLWDGRSTAAIGSFSADAFGLFDMAGNVYEWCLDNRHDNYTDAPSDGTPWLGGKYPEWRINRSGSWRRNPNEMRVFARCWDKESYSSNELGFRLVMAP